MCVCVWGVCICVSVFGLCVRSWVRVCVRACSLYPSRNFCSSKDKDKSVEVRNSLDNQSACRMKP